jgi:hypothetical protein
VKTKAKPVREVKFSNLEKIFFPAARFTKGDMITYYVEVAPYILPHLRGRPMASRVSSSTKKMRQLSRPRGSTRPPSPGGIMPDRSITS